MNLIANSVPQAKLINVLPTEVDGDVMNRIALKVQQAKVINAPSTAAESGAMNRIVIPAPKVILTSA